MKKFTVYFHESGEVEVRSRTVIDKYDLAVPFDNFDTEEFEEEIKLKASPEIKDGIVTEIWHCFKLLEHFNRGYYRHQKVEYSHSEKRGFVFGEVIETYKIK